MDYSIQKMTETESCPPQFEECENRDENTGKTNYEFDEDDEFKDYLPVVNHNWEP